MPLRRPWRLVLAAVLAWSAMLAAVFCVRAGTDTGPLLGATAVACAVAAVGVTLQSSAACLGAMRVGDREPSPLPGRLMEDYLRPGVGVLVALALLATGLGFVMPELADLHVPRIARIGVLVIAAIYGVMGFVLSAAGGSSLGYLDLRAMARLAVRSPIRASVVALPATAVMIACGFAASRVLPRALAAAVPELLARTGIATALALGATFALCVCGATMGALVRAAER
jgi:hypothetical protein